jgi:putative FmdB family regulatory protein
MPLYTYTCSHHGEFSAWGKMSESDAPQPCPACAEAAPRALARPAIGGQSDSSSASFAGACGEGACAAERPSFGGGHCCGGGACMH